MATIKTIEVVTKLIPNHGEIYDIQEFMSECRNHNYIDSDGYGYFVKDNLMYIYAEIYPSMLLHNTIDHSQFKQIVWFNK